jgi:hypothetical protein
MAVDLDFRLIDGYLLSVPAVGLEQVLTPVKLVSDRLVATVHERFDPPVRESSMIQKRP